MTLHTKLYRVVELNEGAKSVLWESQQVSLQALDAVIRSTRAGTALRGFVEVSSQMRQWSRELHSAVEHVSGLSAAQVDAVSALLRQERMLGLLTGAALEAPETSAIVAARDRARDRAEQTQSTLARLRRETTAALEDLQQLGLMASVLARAALIEAASGNDVEREELSIVAHAFATRSEQVLTVMRRMLARHLENSA
jgi:hypothetical protein